MARAASMKLKDLQGGVIANVRQDTNEIVLTIQKDGKAFWVTIDLLWVNDDTRANLDVTVTQRREEQPK